MIVEVDTPYKREQAELKALFQEWRRKQALLEEQQLEEEANNLAETKGCAIMDSGATVMCSSTSVAEEIQMQRLRRN